MSIFVSLKSFYFVSLPDIHEVREVLHLQFRPRRTTTPGDHEGRDGQRPGADVGYSAG